MANELSTTPEWAAIPFAPGYFVSSDGRILGKRGRVLRPFTNRDGYLMATFYVARRHFKQSVHTIVCAVFNGERPDDTMHCAHRDTNKLNNRADNLRWATPKENAEDGMRAGKYSYGDDHWTHRNPEKLKRGDDHHARRNPERVLRGISVYNATLTDEKARAIKQEPANYGLTGRLAARYGVSLHVIRDIRRGRTYKHV